MRSISFRLLLFNILLLFFPLGSLLYLDTYENQMLSSQENSMIQQGRIFSSALAGRDLAAESRRILENLKLRVDSRIRVVDAEGRLLADSAALLPPGDAAAGGRVSPDSGYSVPPPRPGAA
jgi:two-component system sensor histidine kinase ChvG